LEIFKKGKISKTITLFLFFLFGCSRKYLADKEEGLGGRKLSVLDAVIVARDSENLSLNIQVKNFRGILDSLKLEKFYENQSQKESGKRSNYMGACILGGCMLGIDALVYGYYGWELSWGYDLSVPEGCLLIGLLPLEIVGFVNLYKSSSKYEEFDAKVLPYALIDKVYMGSAVVSIGKVKVIVENSDFKKIYWTDKNGNIELKFNEIIPESTVDDSMFNLIVQYEELFDTVNVNIMKMGD
jgi:hypothetical protein